MSKKKPAFIPCTLKEFPLPDGVSRIGVLGSKFWGSAGARLGVGWMDNPPADLRARILRHANAWGENANVEFYDTTLGNAHIRVARIPGDGYYSYLAKDCLRVPAGQPTMNFDSFTMQTADSEFFRVVRHEFGHALGAIHEHARRAIVQQLDEQKTITYFMRTQGWSAEMVRQQVLTPIEEVSLLRPSAPEDTSIMCYGFPGSLTKSGRPIPGGTNITPSDAAYMASIYPLVATPQPPSEDEWQFTIRVNEKTNKAVIVG